MGVRYLLDTHVLLWLLGTVDRVPAEVRGRLADRRNELLVSAASALEIATKVRIGKLDAPGLPEVLAAETARIGATALSISLAHAGLAGSLRWTHRDPFDRLLVAQARLEHATLVTVDDAVRELPDLPLLSW